MNKVFTAALILIIVYCVCPVQASAFGRRAGILQIGLWQEDSNPAPTLGWEKWREEEVEGAAATVYLPPVTEPLSLADTNLLMSIQTDDKGNHWATITNEGGAEIARINLSGISNNYVLCTYHIYKVLKKIGLSYDAYQTTLKKWNEFEQKRFRTVEYKDLFPELPTELTGHKRHFLKYAGGFLKRIRQLGLPEESAASILLSYSSFLGRRLPRKPTCYSESI